ncbi:AAA family ATPase [Promicromonospora sp. NPDC057138]|uniref:AAA family ATPase n=1 Tax=Promicromonospora sp. NPDC057138 TaxID=3346031 RepID=UPI0036430CF9
MTIPPASRNETSPVPPVRHRGPEARRHRAACPADVTSVPSTSPRRSPATALGHRLDLARERAFVGRDEQTAAFRKALAEERASTVLFLHGAGGTGKTALLRRFAHEAEDAGRPVVRAGSFDPARSAALLAAELSGTELSGGTEHPGSGHSGSGHSGAAGPVPGHLSDAATNGAAPVLLIDDFDDWHPAEAWLREVLLPALPLGTVVVLAGRTPPALEWTTDPGWQELLSVHELWDLPPAEARLLLDRRSVPADEHANLLAITDGNPLALLVAVDAHNAGGSDDAVRLAVAHVVLQRVVGPIPSHAHRRALEACATSEPTTEASLGAADDAAGLFQWLRSLSFVDSGPGGLHLRPFVREAVIAERRWRNPSDADHEPARRSTRRSGKPRVTTGDPARLAGPGRDTPDGAPPGDPASGGPQALSRGAFESEVREALRSWRRPDLLATNPLTGSRLVTQHTEPDPVAALRAVLQGALDELSQDPRESKSHRALLATYLGGAPTQEAAAERLGLPFSTYRRHLAQGLAVLGSLLWWQETRDGQPG